MIGDILSPTHLLFVLVVALLVLGPKRLPEAGRALGRGIRDFRSAIGGEEDHHNAIPTTASAPAPAPPATTVQAPAEPAITGAEPAITGAEPAITGTEPAITGTEPPTGEPPTAEPATTGAEPPNTGQHEPPVSEYSTTEQPSETVHPVG
jgi:sec-independent protein translocase protein TatA